MATVIYLPKKESIGETLGKVGGAFVQKGFAEERKAKRAEQLGNLFAGLSEGGEAGTKVAKDAITSGAITDPSDVVNLVGQLRKNKAGDTIKVDAFTPEGKKVPFAVSKQDLTTGAGEANANKVNLTLTNPGKQKDYYEDTPAQKYMGSSGSRIADKITLDEWKSKYGKIKTPTDKDTAIGDYLKGSKDKYGKAFQSTSINRKRAREFLYNRSKATEVINAAFGKKTGQDWTIDDPIKNQMAIIAKMQVEGFIMQEGLSAEQAGSQAVLLAKEALKYQDIEVGGNDGKVETKTINIQTNKEYIGELNDQAIEIPQDMESPVDVLTYIMNTYKVSKEDARNFLLDNMPTE